MAKSWKTRTGSSLLKTVTALVRRICSVRAAAAPSTTRRGHCEIGAVVLAYSKDVETELGRRTRSAP